jgi:RNA methyltransferase, TrmH family
LTANIMDIISSHSNPKIKQVRALHQRKARQAGELFIVEGIRHVAEAVEAHLSLEFIVYAPERLKSGYAQDLIQKQSLRGLPCYAVTREVFVTLADKENPQGILAVARRPKTTLSDLTAQGNPWLVALVDPQDPGNLGAIMRTIDAVGASGLLLLSSGPTTSGLADPYHPHAVRASMGTLFWHPLASAAFSEFLPWAQAQDYHLYGASAHGALDYKAIQSYQLPCILLMGSEREGLTAVQASACKALIRLPMHGHATSLNLAVAAGVMLYEMLHKME